MSAKFKYIGGYPGFTRSMWGDFKLYKEGVVFKSALKFSGIDELHFPYNGVTNIQLEKADNPNVAALLTTGFIGLVWKNKVLVISFVNEKEIPCNAAFQEKSTEITGQMRRQFNDLLEGWHRYLSEQGMIPPAGEVNASAASLQPGTGVEDDTKACPFCAETIKAAAIKCKHCGSDLSVT